MAKRKAASRGTVKKVTATISDAPKSRSIAERGVMDSGDFCNLMSALMGDVLTDRVEPKVANAAINAGSKLLKMVEMQQKYGVQKKEQSLRLAGE